MQIKILGPGCKNGVNLERNARVAVADLGLDAEVMRRSRPLLTAVQQA